MHLQRTFVAVYDVAQWATEDEGDDIRELPTRLCEGCVCFTAHGELKRRLLETPRALHGLLDFMNDVDLSQPSIAFAVASCLFNLCRADGDLEVMDGTSAVLQSELRQESILGILYPDVLAKADAGSAELAARLRAIVAAPAAALLARCAESSSPGARSIAAFALRLLCGEPEQRAILAESGAVGGLLTLLASETEERRPGIQRALAQACITADPSMFSLDEQMRAVGPFVQLMQYSDVQLQLEGAMALTNLLTTGDELRSLALQAGAWGLCRDLLFSEDQNVRRAAIEAMCNFTASPEVVEFCASGQGDLEIQVFASFCAAPDHGTRVAATGALAMLAGQEEVALRIASGSRCQRLVEVFAASEDPDIEHRVASCLSTLYNAPGLPAELQLLIWESFQEKQEGNGFASSEAEALVLAVLEDTEETR